MSLESIRKKDTNKTLTEGELLQKMARYCSYQDRSQFEVEQKLREYYMPVAVRNKILDFLVDERFLDEIRFVDSFVRSKFRQKKWGRRKIIAHLKAKKITSSKIEKGLEQIKEEDYRTLIYDLARRKHQEVQSKQLGELKEKVRIVNFLAQRGFENELVFEVLNELYR